jgi:hypothetical protein
MRMSDPLTLRITVASVLLAAALTGCASNSHSSDQGSGGSTSTTAGQGGSGTSGEPATSGGSGTLPEQGGSGGEAARGGGDTGGRATSGGGAGVASGGTSKGGASAASGGSSKGGSGGAVGVGGATSKVAFPLKVDGPSLVDQNNVPFMPFGVAAWSLLVQLTRAEAETYLETRRQQGFNLLLVNLLEHSFSDDPPNNVFGDGPFTTPGDYATPNEAYFAHADWVLQKAAEKGIAVLLTPTYLGFEGGDEGWYQEMVANGATKMRSWGRYVGDRYKSFDNLIWLEGGDYTPPQVALVNAVAEGIKERDTRHIHSAHWSPETSGSEIKVSGWMNLDTTYTYEAVYLKSLEDYRRMAGLPRIFIEGAYEGEHESTPKSLRGQAYYALLTGARGQVFGNSPIWRFGAGWAGQLNSAGATSMTRVMTLFRALDWTKLIPDVGNTLLVSGAGTSGSSSYAVAARSMDGRLALVYLPASRSITLNLALLTGPVRARWYDPSAGTYANVTGSPLTAAAQTALTPPARNAGGDTDWLLLLESEM